MVVMAWGDIMKENKQIMVSEERITHEQWHKGR